MMAYVWLIAGFALLIKGADFFVDGAAALAQRFHIPQVIIGLTIVALGTSLPELAVSVSASLEGSNALAISNVVGSNLFNTLVVVGASALVFPFVLDYKLIGRDLLVNIGATLLLVVCLWMGGISRIAGVVFLILLLVYLYFLIRQAKAQPVQEKAEESMGYGKLAILIVLGAAAIALGGQITVDAAKDIALQLGMSETLIGLTVAAVGTSLPELVTSLTAAKKGDSGLSLGNAIGSNILNILFILGLSAVLHPLSAEFYNLIDGLMLLVVAVAVFLLCRFSNRMSRYKGAAFVLCYIGYMIYTIVR